MKCAAALSTFTCSNTTGTTCTRVAVTLPAINANTTCAAADLVILTQPEYTTMVSNITTATNTANTATTTANTAATGNTSQTAQITALQTDVGILKAWSGAGGSVPNTDVLAAQSIIFGVTFGALCVIWGLKRVFNLFRTPDHE